jgi:undecaprenyl-diphosphatase
MAGGRAAALAAVIVAGLAFLVLAIWVPAGPSVADAFDPGFRASLPAWAATALDALNLAGSLPVWIALVLLAAALVWGRRRLAVEVIGVSVLTEALTTVVRVLVDRPRPPLGVNTELVVAAGFPSGHVARTVVFTAALLVVLPFARRHPGVVMALGAAVVGLMALARLAVAAHYATDTLGGVLLGAVVVAGWSFLRRRGAG